MDDFFVALRAVAARIESERLGCQPAAVFAETNPCTPRTFDLSDAVPAPTAIQPVLDANKVPVQWLHIDVVGVEAL